MRNKEPMEEVLEINRTFDNGWRAGMEHAINVIIGMNEQDGQKPNWWEYVEALKKELEGK